MHLGLVPGALENGGGLHLLRVGVGGAGQLGAAVGAVANYRLVGHLGQTAIMAYRMRVLR